LPVVQAADLENDHSHDLGSGVLDASSADAPCGRLLASASGAYDERDGAQSDLAARFAFTVITTVDDLSLASATASIWPR